MNEAKLIKYVMLCARSFGAANGLCSERPKDPKQTQNTAHCLQM